ncbi:hypothetical protein ACMFMF_007579 [Clarireedia jacksonii]
MSSEAISQPKPRTFTRFSSLPTELRLQIWQRVVPDPRTVCIRYELRRVEIGGSTLPGSWMSNEPVPVLLHICRESREIGLSHYQLAFGSVIHEAKVYFDFERDCLRFGQPLPGESEDWGHMTGPRDYNLDLFLGGGFNGADDAEKVRYLSIDVTEDLFDRAGFCFDDLREFRALKKVEMWTWLIGEWDPQLQINAIRDKLREVMLKNKDWKAPEIVARFANGLDRRPHYFLRT